MLKTVSSITNAIGALNYKGTWNASTNSPTLASGVGTKGDYYVVGTAGSTTLDGISNWGIGDWVAFNGSTWQRVEGGADLNGVNLSVSGTSTLSGLTASTALALNANKEVVSVTNTGTGNNVLSTSPALTTPNIGAATATSVTSVNTSTTVFSANIGGTNFGADIGSIGNANTCTAINFNSNYGASVGSITVGATTSFNNSSDYRLKQNVRPMTGRLQQVMQLKPVTYNWKFDDSPGEGFIAHELAEVCLFAVTGEKDAVNEDGSIKAQGVDPRHLVAILTAAIQEQQAQIEQLKADVASLKGV